MPSRSSVARWKCCSRRRSGWRENRDEIAAAIELGFAEAERGELIDGDEVRSRMAARKNAWMAEKRSA
jgi:hypothetical protein